MTENFAYGEINERSFSNPFPALLIAFVCHDIIMPSQWVHANELIYVQARLRGSTLSCIVISMETT